MWIDLLACRLVFPKGRAKEWLAATIDPFEDTGSTYWTEALHRASSDGIDIGEGAKSSVRDILRLAGRVDVDRDVVTVRGADLTGDTRTLGRVLGAVAAFAHASTYGGRGVMFALGVQQAYADDADDLVHWVDGAALEGARVHAEEALELRDRLKRLDTDAFDPAMYTAHPSGDDTEYPEDEGFGPSDGE